MKGKVCLRAVGDHDIAWAGSGRSCRVQLGKSQVEEWAVLVKHLNQLMLLDFTTDINSEDLEEV